MRIEKCQREEKQEMAKHEVECRRNDENMMKTLSKKEESFNEHEVQPTRPITNHTIRCWMIDEAYPKESAEWLHGNLLNEQESYSRGIIRI